MSRLYLICSVALASWLVPGLASAAPASMTLTADAVSGKPENVWIVGKGDVGDDLNDESIGAKKRKKRRHAKPARRGRHRRNRWRPKKTRAKGPQKPPAARVRRATAGAGADVTDPTAPSPELQALQQAEREMFSSPAAAPPLPVGFPPALTALPTPGEPVVFDTGLPPDRSVFFDRDRPPASHPDYVDRLKLPDWPVRWSERVVSYLSFYKTERRGRTIAAIWYRRSGRYEPMIHQILKGYGLPTSLMWVAVVESGLRPSVFSSAGAAGLWQMMPQTARLYGLVVDRWVDERLDPVRSTRAAVLYLQDLYRRFGSWDLALAAYNMGFGGLLASVRKYNTNDYWELCRYEAAIPWETTLYVPKIKAMSVVAANPKSFGLDPDKREPAVQFDEVDAVPGTSLQQIADAAEVDIADIQELNPQLLADRVPPRLPKRKAAGVWHVRVPKGRGAKVVENLVKVRVRQPKLRTHVMRRGERLQDVARGYGVSVGWLKRVNAVRSDEVLSPGTVVLVPGRGRRRAPAESKDKTVVVVRRNLRASAGFRRVFYHVVPGDTLRGIASALGVNADMLSDWNGVDVSARLQRGMTLQALVPARRDLGHMKVAEQSEVRTLLVGTEAFFTYFEGKRGRVRVAVRVRPGESWRDVAKRTHVSVGSLERINRRSRRKPLHAGERLYVYVTPQLAAHLQVAEQEKNLPPEAASPSEAAQSPAPSEVKAPATSPSPIPAGQAQLPRAPRSNASSPPKPSDAPAQKSASPTSDAPSPAK